MEYPLNCSQMHALKGNTSIKTKNKTRENTKGCEEARHPGEKRAATTCGGAGRGGLVYLLRYFLLLCSGPQVFAYVRSFWASFAIFFDHLRPKNIF